MDKKFSVVIPAQMEKSEDGQWRVFGLASTAKRDQQGEVVNLQGLDLSPIQSGKGIFNFDHKKGPENCVGIIDTYKKDDSGLYLGGYLFKNHDRAKALYQIMSSLGKSDRGRMGMSVEGVIKQRTGEGGKIINKAVINSCALTMNPVNQDTYINLVKSFDGVDFEKNVEVGTDILPEDTNPEDGKITFTPEQVVTLMQKALAVGGEYASTKPSERSGGAALAQEDLDHKPKSVMGSKSCKCEAKKACKCMKSLKKADSTFFKSQILEAMDELTKLYPEVPKYRLWELFKDRLSTRFGELD